MYRCIKRILDIALSFCALAVLSPLFLLLAVLIRLDSPGKVLFRQNRVGIHRKPFAIWKFRTMRSDTPSDVPTHLLRDPQRHITRAGKILRRTSLDELPQLWNIFRGDMSFIGPRPALHNQQDLLEEREKYGANGVPVGLSGWAQIHGRDELGIAEKARLDGEYTQRFGFVMDCRCFFGTFFAVARQKGVAEGGRKP